MGSILLVSSIELAIRRNELGRRLLTDPHGPSRYRANGPVSNLDAFYEAFEVEEGDTLWKPEHERIRIW
jgi:putative endopeptidase